MKVKIRPSSNLIDSIGKNLIIDEISAIVELIKNSYDADAENVFIKFYQEGANLLIEIKDDGNGMSFSTVENNWMVPATDYKKKNKYSSKKKRRVLGEKGLGRYSVGILGNFLALETIKNSKKTLLKIEWDKIKNFQYLDEIEFEMEEKETNENNGTKLLIKKENFQLWDEIKKKTLEKELKKLLFPLKEENDNFKIFLEYKNFEIYNKQKKIEIINKKIEIVPFELLEYYDLKLVGVINKKNEISYEIFSKNEKSLEKNIITKEYIGKILEDKGGKFPGEFKVDFRFFNREPAAINDLKNYLKKENNEEFGKVEVRALLDEISGVSIYKNKFRIRPYGEEEYDWLQLNKRRFLNPSMKISNNQLNGTVSLSDDTFLSEKSARDGLQENEYFLGLKVIVLELLTKLEIKMSFEKKKEGKKENFKEKNLFENIGNFKEVKEKIKLKAKQLDIPEKGIEEFEKIIDKKEIESQKEIKEIKEIVIIYAKHITLGKLTNKIIHEGRKSLAFFRNGCNYLKREIKNFVVSPIEDIKNKLFNKIEDFELQRERLSQLFKSIEPLSSRKRTNPKLTNLIEVIKESLVFFESELEKVNLVLELENIECTIIRDDFVLAICNIVENSLYWLNFSKKKSELKIKLYKTNLEKIRIDFIDNGPGIKEEYIENGIIFEFGFSSKEDGTGLGLSMAGEALQRNNFELKVKAFSEGAYIILEEK